MAKPKAKDKSEGRWYLVTLQFGAQQVYEEVFADHYRHAFEKARGKLQGLGLHLPICPLDAKPIPKRQGRSYSLKHRGAKPLGRKSTYARRIGI